MRYKVIPSQLFSDRRRGFLKQMKRHSVAVFYSNEAMPRSADQSYPFRQDSSLFALSGLDQQGSILVLVKGGKEDKEREIGFVLPQDPDNTIWNGERLSLSKARKISGIRSIHETTKWDKLVAPLLRRAKMIYVNAFVENGSVPKSNSLLLNDRMAIKLRSKFPEQKFISAKSILAQQLMVKHKGELALINEAIQVTSGAFNRVLENMKPGMREYEVEAELTYHLARHGCRHAFDPIVASSKSACTLHYIKNDGLIRSGDLVLIDFGAEYACMSSDMTRTIPASGVFSNRQKQIYKSVQRVLQEITALMRPGITLKELNAETGKRIDRELVRLKIVSNQELKKQDPKNPIRRKYFMHGVSHHMGYDVHDQSDRFAPLKAGMVLTCEPGLYIPEENIGIRLENDILITRGKPKNLMADVPLDPDEIEERMNSF